MKLNERVIRSMRVAKVLRDNSAAVNHLHFSADGASLISSSDDDQIIIYDSVRGTKSQTLNSKKYGVDLIHFTASKANVVHASTKENDIIRYLNVHENKYMAYFRGHTKKVVTLSTSPADELFVSGSLDNTIRLWDLRSANPQGVMHLAGRPVAAFDPEGLIFAAGVNSESVKLYDLRSFDHGPFSSFKFNDLNDPFGGAAAAAHNGKASAVDVAAHNGKERECEWSGLKFSPDGKTILISTNGALIRLIDAFTGATLQTFVGRRNACGVPLEAAFSPDSQFVISGSADGRVLMWSAASGAPVAVLNGDHDNAVRCVQFNPKYMMMASACNDMAFWLPSVDDDS